MAIIKGINNVGKTKSALRNLMKYVGEKAEQTIGFNCNNNYDKATSEFIQTKATFEKENGRQYMHYVISFKEGEIENEKAMELASKFIEKNFNGHEVFSALHTDKKHTHVHIVINSVNFENGKLYHQSNKEMYDLKRDMNVLCKSYGLEIPQKSKEKGKIISWDKNKYMSIKSGIEKNDSDIVMLAKNINQVAHHSKDKKEFISNMFKKGYKVEWEEQKKNVVFIIDGSKLKGKKNRFRLSNLEKTFNDKIFTKGGLEDEFIRTRERYTRENGIVEEKLVEIRGRENEAERRIGTALGTIKSRTNEKSSIDRGKSRNQGTEHSIKQKRYRTKERDKGLER